MRRTAVVLSALAVIVAVAATALLRAQPASGVRVAVDKNMTELLSRVATKAMLDSEEAASSNPYDYTSDSAFQRIVALGTPALPVIERSLRASGGDGLREYLLAIAGERIAGVDLKRDRSLWQSGKEWPRVWKAHLQAVPGSVAAIAASRKSAAEKDAELVALGTPAAPYIADRVAAGQEELAPALKALSSRMPEVPEPPARVTRAWASRNKASFEPMRKVVAEAR